MEINSFVELVRAYEVTEKYARLLNKITGYGCSFDEDWDVGGKLYEVIRDNSIYAGREDDKAEDTFGAIVNATNISPEIKVFLLLGLNERDWDDLDE